MWGDENRCHTSSNSSSRCQKLDWSIIGHTHHNWVKTGYYYYYVVVLLCSSCIWAITKFQEAPKNFGSEQKKNYSSGSGSSRKQTCRPNDVNSIDFIISDCINPINDVQYAAAESLIHFEPENRLPRGAPESYLSRANTRLEWAISVPWGGRKKGY